MPPGKNRSPSNKVPASSTQSHFCSGPGRGRAAFDTGLRKMGASELIFITLGHSVSFVGENKIVAVTGGTSQTVTRSRQVSGTGTGQTRSIRTDLSGSVCKMGVKYPRRGTGVAGWADEQGGHPGVLGCPD